MGEGTPRVAICCDVDPSDGAVHVVRCLALAEELVLRGVEAVFVCDADSMSWAQAQLGARGLRWVQPVETAHEHVDLLERLGADAVVFDSHRLSGEVYADVRGTGRRTLAVVDGDLRGAEADVLVDPNPGAEEGARRVPRGSALLAGLDYALLRNDVLANRPFRQPADDSAEIPTVLVWFGEHEALAAVDGVARLLVESGRPFDATFVASHPEVGSHLQDVRPAPRQRLGVGEPTYRYAERIVGADVVLTGSGLSALEALCLGAAAGLVWVDEAQVQSYRALMVRRAVVGLGAADGLRSETESGVEKVSRLLGDVQERSRLAGAAWSLVDGMGRARVADELLAP